MGQDLAAFVKEQVTAAGKDRGRLMDIVQAVQNRFGHVGGDGIAAIASALGMHAGDVVDMVSFYAFFSRTPTGRFHIRLSRTPISLMKGAEEVAHAFTQMLGIAVGQSSSDGLFTLDWTSDLGMGDQEPAALVNGTMLTILVPADIPRIVTTLRQAAHGPTRPLFPGSEDGTALPNARVRSNVIRGGPLLSDPILRGDGIRAALTRSPEQVIADITAAKLRGRGGAGFPTGLKWRLCRQSGDHDRHVICNADEGEPGTFKDRVLLTEVPDLVFDGMTIAGYALGARRGVLYLRGEYSYLLPLLRDTLEARRRLGLLGSAVCGHEGFDFDIRIQVGAGAYI